MKLSSHALRALQDLDETGREAVEQIVRAHIRACRLNGFQPENLERVYQEAIEIIRLEGPPKEIHCSRLINTNRHAVMSNIVARALSNLYRNFKTPVSYPKPSVINNGGRAAIVILLPCC